VYLLHIYYIQDQNVIHGYILILNFFHLIWKIYNSIGRNSQWPQKYHCTHLLPLFNIDQYQLIKFVIYLNLHDSIDFIMGWRLLNLSFKLTVFLRYVILCPTLIDKSPDPSNELIRIIFYIKVCNIISDAD
jgi:hypothetical protein